MSGQFFQAVENSSSAVSTYPALAGGKDRSFHKYLILKNMTNSDRVYTDEKPSNILGKNPCQFRYLPTILGRQISSIP